MSELPRAIAPIPSKYGARLQAAFLLRRCLPLTDIGDCVQTHHFVITGEQPALLWTRDELGHLISRSGNPSETLTNIVHLIHRQFATDVCSVYLLEPDRANLVLAATIGLRPESVGRVRMRLTKGLVGLVAEQVRPVVVHDITTHPRFKYFRDAGEDPYRTFLGVPVVDRDVLQGVLVVQTAETR